MDALFNWTCQAMLVAGATTGLMAGTRSLNASTRHAIWWLTLVVAIGMGAWTLIPHEVATGALDGSTLTGSNEPILALPETPIWVPIAIGLLWTAWVVTSLVRLMLGLAALVGSRRALIELPPHRQARLVTWSRIRTTGRRVRLAVAHDLSSACLLGLRDPIIALPSWMLERLDDEAIDQIVVHEWAHLERRDDVGALVQAVILAIVGWHPVIMWIDRAIRFEREAACDDWVVALTSDRTRYASCLATVAAAGFRGSSTLIAPPLAIPGRTAIARRILRLLGSKPSTEVGLARRTTVAAGLGMLAAAVWLVQVHAVGSPEPRIDREAAPPRPSVYWAASFRAPTAPVLRPSRTTSFSVSRPDGGIREVRVTTEGVWPAADSARKSHVNRLPAPMLPAGGDVLSAEPPAGFERPAKAPVVVAVQTGQPDHSGDGAGARWAPAVNVSEGAVRMAQELGRGSRQAAVSTGRFFARIGRSIAAASPRTDGSRSSEADRQP
jgi:beta-lactamase regulating signal transducer with metallopeptidase domain